MFIYNIIDIIKKRYSNRFNFRIAKVPDSVAVYIAVYTGLHHVVGRRARCMCQTMLSRHL